MQYQRFSTIHEHCRTCYSRECSRVPDYATSCEMIRCDFVCGRIFHACKQDAHMQVCPFRIVPCVNKGNGCYLEVRKSDMATHLMVCPASVVVCQNYVNTPMTNGCQKNVRREEYSWHNLNVHAEISSGTTLACPLAIAGCGFTCQKLTPSVPECQVVLSALLSSYGTVTECKMDQSPFENDNSVDNEDQNSCGIRSQIWEPTNVSATNRHSDGFGLDDLPVNVLEDIILLLDSFSINNLSLTNTFLRDMCKSVLYKKGMVIPVWSKSESGRVSKWNCLQWKWSFSTCFTPIRQWKYHLSTPLSEHLKACPFYPERQRNDNEIIECENKCGLSFPKWQLQEHKKRCQLEIVTCINKVNGCQAVVTRSKMAVHLRSCPANVVQCNAQCNAHNTREEMNGVCRRMFRREEIKHHQQFTHLDICEDIVLSCPFKNDGCTFAVDKRTPRIPKLNVSFDNNSKVFNVISLDKESELNNLNYMTGSDVNSSLADDMSTSFYPNQTRADDIQTNYFEKIPLVLKQHIVSFLDSMSIRNLARTSTHFREICNSVLEEKGMVELVWEKSSDESWVISKKKWYFSTACLPVHQWEYHTSSPVSEHLKECPYFRDKNVRSDKVLVMLTTDNLPEMLQTWKA